MFGEKTATESKAKSQNKSIAPRPAQTFGEIPAARPSRKKIKKKQNVPSVKRSPRSQAPSAVLAPGVNLLPEKFHRLQPAQAGQPVGEITHYFSKIQVVVVKMTKGNLAVGDKVRISSPQGAFGQRKPAGRSKSTDLVHERGAKVIKKCINEGNGW